MTAPIDNASLPAEVRASGANGEKLYQAALGFESVLLQMLTQSMTDATSDDGSDDSSGDGSDDSVDSTDPLTSRLAPDALAQSVSGSGGTGLALELWRAMRGPGS